MVSLSLTNLTSLPIFVCWGQKCCGASLTFYKLKWSAIASSDFVLMRLSYISVVKTFNVGHSSSKLYICCICSGSPSVCKFGQSLRK